jgi:predicted alpha/beta hydrolase family esterase
MAAEAFIDFRVLVVPGLQNSGPEHWQSRWQRRYPAFERVEQDDWDRPQLPAWSARVGQLRARDRRPTLVVAHSFGCLAAVHGISRDASGVAGLLLVAPADPDKFGVAAHLPRTALPCPAIMISSSNDPYQCRVRPGRLGVWPCSSTSPGRGGANGDCHGCRFLLRCLGTRAHADSTSTSD